MFIFNLTNGTKWTSVYSYSNFLYNTYDTSYDTTVV